MSAQVEAAVEPEAMLRINKRAIAEEPEDESSVKQSRIEEPVRIKKRNYAMMLSYLGKDYYGMQRNPGMKTIEEDLINALLKADLISNEAFETIQTIHFQRAARTDKGVSATRQIVSLRMRKDRLNLVILYKNHFSATNLEFLLICLFIYSFNYSHENNHMRETKLMLNCNLLKSIYLIPYP